MIKRCSVCLEDKSIENFGKRSDSRDGLSNRCRGCVKAYNSKYYQNNRERLIDSQRVWASNNLEKKRAKDTKYQRRPDVMDKHHNFSKSNRNSNDYRDRVMTECEITKTWLAVI